MYIKQPLNSGNLCITNCFSVPKVSVIERFHCIFFDKIGNVNTNDFVGRKFPRLPDEKNFNTSQLAPAARNETVTTYIVAGILAFLFSGSTIVLCIAIICYCCQKNRHCKRILPSLQRGSLSSSRNSYSAPVSNEIQLEDATIPHNKVSTKSDNHQCTIKDEHTVKLMAPKSDVSSPFHLHQSERFVICCVSIFIIS